MTTGFEIDNDLGIIMWGGLYVVLGTKPYACPAGVAVGDAVYITGADAVDKADASAIGTSPAFGLVRFKPSTTECIVQSSGEMDVFAGLTAGDTYYLSASTPGGITNVTPGNGETVQPLGFARNGTTLFVLIDPKDVLTV